MPVYAECGGLMYLTEGIREGEKSYPLVSAVPGRCEMGDHLVMGYREVEVVRPIPFGLADVVLRGHEFHYSTWSSPVSGQAPYRVLSHSSHFPARLEGYVRGNLLASYVHLHFVQNPQLAENFVTCCLNWAAAHA